MNMPKKSIQTVLRWMQEQMYEKHTEWTYGNEHDRMDAARDLLEELLRKGDEDTP